MQISPAVLHISPHVTCYRKGLLLWLVFPRRTVAGNYGKILVSDLEPLCWTLSTSKNILPKITKAIWPHFIHPKVIDGIFLYRKKAFFQINLSMDYWDSKKTLPTQQSQLTNTRTSAMHYQPDITIGRKLNKCAPLYAAMEDKITASALPRLCFGTSDRFDKDVVGSRG